MIQFPRIEPMGREILVRVRCCTLCRSDLHTHAGRRVEPTPTVLGHEVVGRIEAFGPEADPRDALGDEATVGDRISWAVAVGCGSCFFCAADLPQKCERPYKYGHQRFDPAQPRGGGLADFIVLVPGTYWLKIPDRVSDHVAAPANCATATVAAMLRSAGAVEGRHVLVLGAGMLGLTACAMAHSAGARSVVVADPLESSRRRALLFGATHAFPSAPDLLPDAVRSVTSGRGADVVLELAGATESVDMAMKLPRTGGTVVLAGSVSPQSPISIDPEQIVRRMLCIRGVHNYHPVDLSGAFQFLAGPGHIFPWSNLIVAEFPLERVEEAFALAHAQPGVRVAVAPGS